MDGSTTAMAMSATLHCLTGCAIGEITGLIIGTAVMAVIPGAMNAGLVNVVFWLGMMLSLPTAFVAAFPVNRYLLERGKGHSDASIPRRECPSAGLASIHPAFDAGALAAVIVAFMLGGLVVALADQL